MSPVLDNKVNNDRYYRCSVDGSLVHEELTDDTTAPVLLLKSGSGIYSVLLLQCDAITTIHDENSL